MGGRKAPWSAGALVALVLLLLTPTADGQTTFVMQQCPPPGCPANTFCTVDQREFCASKKCVLERGQSVGRCAAATCSDGLMNSWETFVDCGGECKGCIDNAPCFAGQDCRNGVCLFRTLDATVRAGEGGGACQGPQCTDLVANGVEADIDCGDTACCAGYKVKADCPYRCREGYKCASIYDCRSERCYRNSKLNGEKYCAAQRVSDSKPEFGTRVQGGVAVYGRNKVNLDPAPLMAAVAFMTDAPVETVVVDALQDIQRTREYGNTSYLDVRRTKGWPAQPASSRRRLVEEARQLHVTKQTGYPSPVEVSVQYGFGQGRRESGGWGALTGFEMDVAARYGEQELAAYRADLGLDMLDMHSSSSSSSGSSSRFLQINPISNRYNLSITDTTWGVNARFLVYAATDEATLIQARVSDLLTMQLLPGGWAAERALQRQLAEVEQDKEFCLQFWNFTLASFNETGVDCSPYISDNSTATNGTDTSSNSTAGNGGSSSANTTSGRRLLRGSGSDSGSDSGAWPRRLSLSLSPTDTSYLSSPYFKQRIRQYVANRCRLPGGGYSAACEEQARASRRLGVQAGAASHDYASGHGYGYGYSSGPRRLSVTSADLGVLPEVPRVNFTDMLTYYGLYYDPVQKVQFLDVGTIDPNSDPVSSYLSPRSLTVERDPRGTPLAKLYMGVRFPIQPLLQLRDRHGRAVTELNRELKVTAFLDEGLYPQTFEDPLIVPVQLLGFKGPLASADGTVHYDDLQVTSVVKGMIINFTASYINAFGTRITMNTATRPFDVLEPPPKIIIIYQRIPMSPILVALCLIAGLAAVPLTTWSVTRLLTWLRTPKPKAELMPKPPPKAAAAEIAAIDYNPHEAEMAKQKEAVHTGGSDGGGSQSSESIGDKEKEPPPPVFHEHDLPGLGPSFQAAFANLEGQLMDLEDDEGDADEAEEEISRFLRDREPEEIAAEAEAARKVAAEAEARAARAAAKVTLRVGGRSVDLNVGALAVAALDAVKVAQAAGDQVAAEAAKASRRAVRRASVTLGLPPPTSILAQDIMEGGDGEGNVECTSVMFNSAHAVAERSGTWATGAQGNSNSSNNSSSKKRRGRRGRSRRDDDDDDEDGYNRSGGGGGGGGGGGFYEEAAEADFDAGRQGRRRDPREREYEAEEEAERREHEKARRASLPLFLAGGDMHAALASVPWQVPGGVDGDEEGGREAAGDEDEER